MVYVSSHPTTQVAHTRVIETRGRFCHVRRHEVGLRLYLWEILPDRVHEARPAGVEVTPPTIRCDRA